MLPRVRFLIRHVTDFGHALSAATLMHACRCGDKVYISSRSTAGVRKAMTQLREEASLLTCYSRGGAGCLYAC